MIPLVVHLIPFDYPDIGEQIQHRRKELGLTQLQLADQVPCSTTYISRIENGAKPSLEVIVRIAHILDMSLDTLFCIQGADDTHLHQILRMISNQPPEIRRVTFAMLYAYLQTLNPSVYHLAADSEEPTALLADTSTKMD